MKINEIYGKTEHTTNGDMFHGVDPLADTMKSFNPLAGIKRKKPTAAQIKKQINPDAPYNRYPKNVYFTGKMVSKKAAAALEANEEFVRLRDDYNNSSDVDFNDDFLSWKKQHDELIQKRRDIETQLKNMRDNSGHYSQYSRDVALRIINKKDSVSTDESNYARKYIDLETKHLYASRDVHHSEDERPKSGHAIRMDMEHTLMQIVKDAMSKYP